MKANYITLIGALKTGVSSGSASIDKGEFTSTLFILFFLGKGNQYWVEGIPVCSEKPHRLCKPFEGREAVIDSNGSSPCVSNSYFNQNMEGISLTSETEVAIKKIITNKTDANDCVYSWVAPAETALRYNAFQKVGMWAVMYMYLNN